MTGSEAIEALKRGKAIRRCMWTPGTHFKAFTWDEEGAEDLDGGPCDFDIVIHGSAIFMDDAHNYPGWIAASFLHDDWEVVEVDK